MDATRIDWERAEIVCGRLLAVRSQFAYPYDSRANLPQSYIPEEITRDPIIHARFLFWCCHYMRGTIKSDYAVKKLVELYLRAPQLFDPYVVSLMDFDTVHGYLHNAIVYHSEQIAKAWIENARRLVEYWEGDPRNIFVGLETPNDLYARVTNKAIHGTKPKDKYSKFWGFIGFQKKMASMLAYYLMDAGLIVDIVVSPPVDFHLARGTVATGIIKINLALDIRLGYGQVTPFGITVLEQYCRAHEVRMVDLADALWLLSSVLCSRAPGNRSVGRKKSNGKESKSRPTPAVIDWNNPDTIQQYNRSCGSCPVEDLCRFNVLSGTFYDFGTFTIIEREKPLQLFDSLPRQMCPSQKKS